MKIQKKKYFFWGGGVGGRGRVGGGGGHGGCERNLSFCENSKKKIWGGVGGGGWGRRVRVWVSEWM